MDMKEFNGYTVYSNGVIVNSNGIVMKYYKPKQGDETISLYYDGNTHNITKSKLLATLFIDNPNNYTAIRHIDGNCHNCNISNLEWVEDKKCHGKRAVMCVETGEVYESKSKAARELNLSSITTINNYIKGKQIDPRGYTWKEI